ncbi:MAG TPA: hypothetical protein VKE51_31030 [Vicinamibacterales bacterium]|nr:hypothetical protein [Vicinamibacterales bacterium]
MTRWILAGCAIASLVACDTSDTATLTSSSVLRPDVGANVLISPATFVIGTPVARACPGGVFSPAFALVITPVSSRNMSFRSATFRLIDGTTPGPSVTFPQPQLTNMFGTLVISQPRTFNFAPAFACPTTLPRAMQAEVVMDDGQHLTASMTLQ